MGPQAPAPSLTRPLNVPLFPVRRCRAGSWSSAPNPGNSHHYGACPWNPSAPLVKAHAVPSGILAWATTSASHLKCRHQSSGAWSASPNFETWVAVEPRCDLACAAFPAAAPVQLLAERRVRPNLKVLPPWTEDRILPGPTPPRRPVRGGAQRLQAPQLPDFTFRRLTVCRPSTRPCKVVFGCCARHSSLAPVLAELGRANRASIVAPEREEGDFCGLGRRLAINKT